MKITKLVLKSFRSYHDTDFDLNVPRVLIAGLNGTGKSSVREGIRWLLTGKAQGLDGKGAGVIVLSPTGNGTQAVAVSGALSTVGEMARSWQAPQTSSLRIEGMEGTPTMVQQGLYDKLRTSEAFLEAVLDSGTFLKLHHADAKALVLGLLNVVVTVGEKSYTLDQLDFAYTQAFEDRKSAKQRLKRLVAPIKPVEAGLPALSAVEARLGTLRAELGEAQQTVGTVRGQRQTLESRIIRLEVSGVVSTSARSEAHVDADIEAAEERLSILEAEAVPSVSEPVPVVAPDGEVNVVLLRQQVDRLAAFNPKNGCVLDARIDCPHNRIKFKNRAKDIQEQLDALPTSTVPLSTVVNPLTELRQHLDALRADKARFAAERNRLQSVQTELQTLHAELSALPDISQAEAVIADKQGRIAMGEKKRLEVQAHENAIQAYEVAVQQYKEGEAEVQRFEDLCALLGPSGARVPALEAAMGRFLAEINPITEHFGWTVRFSVDPWECLVNDRPVVSYSTSERYRIGIAIQMAIATISGLGFVIVDELDLLTRENRETMAKVLAFSPLEQVIILASREEDQPLPSRQGLVSYRLSKNGPWSVISERVVA
jgi:hypothetical protein